MTYAKALALTFGGVVIGGGSLIAIGNILNPYWALGLFGVYLGAGIWYYNYNEKKTRCPLQK